MSDALSKITSIMQQNHCMDISPYDVGFVVRILEKRQLETRLADLSEYSDFLASDHQEAETFFGNLHNTFSLFFREPLTFAYLEQSLLPCIVSSKTNENEIRIWSAGCSGGQEPYSLAILLSELKEASQKEIRFRIFATDRCPEALAEATAGVYPEAAVQNVKKRHLDQYFHSTGGRYEIKPELKKHIEFSNYDLLDTTTAYPPESIFGNFDVVMCSNLLIYYKHEFRDFIIHKIRNAVSQDGYLITGEAEKMLVNSICGMKAMDSNLPIFKNHKRG